MGEPTLSVDYQILCRELARQLGYGSTYSTGTLTTSGSSTTITLASGVFPSWVGTSTTGTSAINIAGTLYAVTARTNDTTATIDTAVNLSGATAFVLVQARTDTLTDGFQDIQDCIDEGYREFCSPPPAGQEPYYVWSWLLERTTQALSAADESYDLPENFGQFLDNSVTYAKGSDYENLTFISQKEFRGKQARDDASGTPEYICWRQKTGFDASIGRRFELVLYPTPDATLTIAYLYRVVPNRLSPTNRYALCGALHGDTLMKACQAAAERKLDDESSVYAQKYQERLAASISADQAVKATMGI